MDEMPRTRTPKRAATTVAVVCIQCGATNLYRRSEAKKFCSEACYHRSRVGVRLVAHETRPCEWCEKEMDLTPTIADRRYCSKSCADEAKVVDPAERFWAKVAKPEHPDACWPWIGNMGTDGYGKFWIDGTSKHASRVAWELANGPVADGMHVCHRCDNPRCVRPSHLWLGTASDNSRDMMEKGRGAIGIRHGSRTHPERVARGERHGSVTKPESRRRGSAHPAAQLTEDDVRAIRRDYRPRYVTKAVLADRYGVSERAIKHIVSGKTWRHVSD